VSTKAVAGAKTIGSFLFSAVNKAGETVSKAGAKIKRTVGENVSSKNHALIYDTSRLEVNTVVRNFQ